MEKTALSQVIEYLKEFEEKQKSQNNCTQSLEKTMYDSISKDIQKLTEDFNKLKTKEFNFTININDINF